jgi:hypothetical protein
MAEYVCGAVVAVRDIIALEKKFSIKNHLKQYYSDGLKSQLFNFR